ncbi:MAG TPA: nuclease-related domain-containing protein [Acidimicrobiales bacterium]|nr:nuclease-related domain-containing protein [Acidimicrobiales bacterium]
MATPTEEGWEPHAPAFDRGTPGRSAEAEYLRRRARDDQRRRETFGRLAWVAHLVAGERQSTTAWSTGAHGERRVAAELERVLGERGIVLHDRRVPGGWGNIDHLAVAPSGIWVIDAKEYRGRVQRRDVGGLLRRDVRLYVGGRDRSKAIAGVARQEEAVRCLLEHDSGGSVPPLHSVICLVGADWDWFARPFQLDGVRVTWPRRLGRLLLTPAVLSDAEIEHLGALLARRFPVR